MWLVAWGVLASAPCRAGWAQPLATDADRVTRYDGHAVVRTVLRGPDDLRLLEREGLLSISCEASPSGVDLLVPPGKLGLLEELGLTHEVLVADIQPRIDAESARIRASLERYSRGEGSWYDDYKPLDLIDARIDELIARRPDLVSREVIGTTHEGRPIWVMRISGAGDGCRPGFMLNSITHAREWITVMNVMYLAERLVDGYGVDSEITDVVDQVEWFIVPVLNPDGYEHSWTVNRHWRKNRLPHPSGQGRRGVDLNRNYSVDWGSDEGSHAMPYADTYRGAAPFSERETSALRDFVLAHPSIRAHNDTHSYGKDILFPYGLRTDKVENASEFYQLGHSMRQIISKVHGNNFSVGSIRSVLYPVSGGSVDWFYEVAGALTFSYELRGPTFDPDPEHILPGAEETFGATLLHAAHVAERSSFRADIDADCDFDYDDVLAFIVAFGAQEPEGDFVADGEFTIDDVLAFLAAFGGMS